MLFAPQRLTIRKRSAFVTELSTCRFSLLFEEHKTIERKHSISHSSYLSRTHISLCLSELDVWLPNCLRLTYDYDYEITWNHPMGFPQDSRTECLVANNVGRDRLHDQRLCWVNRIPWRVASRGPPLFCDGASRIGTGHDEIIRIHSATALVSSRLRGSRLSPQGLVKPQRGSWWDHDHGVWPYGLTTIS